MLLFLMAGGCSKRIQAQLAADGGGGHGGMPAGTDAAAPADGAETDRPAVDAPLAPDGPPVPDAGSADEPDAGGVACDLGTPGNCGACGQLACPFAASIACEGGIPSCGDDVCVPGFGNCDTTSTDCETAYPGTGSAACFPTYLGTAAFNADIAAAAAGLAADGTSFLASSFRSEVDLDPTAAVDRRLDPDGRSDGFVVRLQPDGAYQWGGVFENTRTFSTAYAITPVPAADGSIAVAGKFEGTMDIDPGPQADLRRGSGSADTFIAKIDASGNLIWGATLRCLSLSCDAQLSNVAFMPDGGVLFAASYGYSKVDFDPGAAEVIRESNDVSLNVVMALGSDGRLRWISTFEQDDSQCGVMRLPHAVVTGDGGALVALTFNGTCDLAPGSVVEPRTTGAATALVRLDGAGRFVRARTFFGAQSVVMLSDVALASDGSVYAGGSFYGTVDFDEGPAVVERTSPGAMGILAGVLIKLTGDLDVTWVSEPMVGRSIALVAAAPDGGVLAAGKSNDRRPFVMTLNGDRKPAWSLAFGGTGTTITTLVTGGGMFALAGIELLEGDLDPGPGVTLVGKGTFLARYRF